MDGGPVTAHASFLALYAAPNTARFRGPRPPRLMLLALALFWIAVACSVTGCAADPTRAHIGLGYAVDRDTWQAAVDEWRRASSGRVALTIDAENTTAADVSVGWDAFQPLSACAYTEYGDTIRLQMNPNEQCAAHELTTALHELGHTMGAEHSSNPADVMYFDNVGTVTLTAADVAQVVP